MYRGTGEHTVIYIMYIFNYRGAGGYWRTYSAPDLATPQAFSTDPSLGIVGTIKLWITKTTFRLQ